MKVVAFLSVYLLFLSAAQGSKLLVGLKHAPNAIADLQREFYEVADPHSPKYQNYLTNEEISRIVGVTDSDFSLVQDWLLSIGAKTESISVVPTKDALLVECKEGHKTAPPVSGRAQDVVDYVLLIKSERDSSKTLHNKTTTTTTTHSDTSMGPSGQKSAYGVPSSLYATQSGNIQMVYGAGSFGYRPDDLDMFFSTYAPWSSTKDVSFDKDNVWDSHTGKNFPEGMLDTSYIAAMAGKAKTLVYNNNNSVATEAGEAYGGALLNAMVDLNNRDIGGSPPLPLVLSMSLGSLSFGSCNKLCKRMESKGKSSYDKCWTYLQTQFQVCMFESQTQVDRIEVEFMKLGLKGVTITAASGDGGSHFAFGQFSDGPLASDLNKIICEEMNMPVYPTSSSYVLSVGGVQWTSDDMYGPECSTTTPCGWSSGGGGFAWTTGSAPYQKSVPADYIKKATQVAPKTMTGPTTYNATGRAYPDLSALAEFGIPLCTYGGCSGSGGTSASAPTVAGMLSLINDARLAKGMKSLGFINTKLYEAMSNPLTYATAFTDVGVEKVDSLWDCDTYSSCEGCSTGFIATKGWDAQTGFGQPKFNGLLKIFTTN